MNAGGRTVKIGWGQDSDVPRRNHRDDIFDSLGAEIRNAESEIAEGKAQRGKREADRLPSLGASRPSLPKGEKG